MQKFIRCLGKVFLTSFVSFANKLHLGDKCCPRYRARILFWSENIFEIENVSKEWKREHDWIHLELKNQIWRFSFLALATDLILTKAWNFVPLFPLSKSEYIHSQENSVFQAWTQDCSEGDHPFATLTTQNFHLYNQKWFWKHVFLKVILILGPPLQPSDGLCQNLVFQWRENSWSEEAGQSFA